MMGDDDMNCTNCGGELHRDQHGVLRHLPTRDIENGSIFCDPDDSDHSTVADVDLEETGRQAVRDSSTVEGVADALIKTNDKTGAAFTGAVKEILGF